MDHNSKRLEQIRKEINKIDKDILMLLNKRASLSLEVGKIKEQSEDSIFKPFREKDILKELEKNNPGPLPKEHLYSIYREILSSSRSLQRPQKVVYLGPEGTFSYFAALHYFGHSVHYSPKFILEDVFKAVRKKEAALGVIPLENSLQGTVGQSLDMFLKYQIYIQAEIFCKISHSLLSMSNSLSQIEIVYSHPQALQQCSLWLKTRLPRAKVVPVDSTAAGAKMACEDPKTGAIAHPALANNLGLNILESGIEDLPENWTRFLIIGPDEPPAGNRDKTSLLFTLPDKPGSLARILNLLAMENVNMKKLESRPLRGEKWQYVFFCDVECDLSKDQYTALLEDLRHSCHTLRILGSYPNGPYIDLP